MSRHKKKRPVARDKSVRRNDLRHSTRPEVAGRLFVQTKKLDDDEPLGMSISVEATAVVKKDGITHIVRARPTPAEDKTG